MNKYLASVSLIAVSSAFSSVAFAQVEEIVVTATKRSENAQDIPVAVQALGGDTLDELRVDNFTDYLTQLPGVTAGGSGPGQNTIYIRGVASTTPNLTTAGVAGLAPNVALYLDEQPLAQPGRNLDVYAVDLERVEVLSGPQGTLFGASSQAGTIRLITNKPKIGTFEAFANSQVTTTRGGEASYKVEGGLNIPVGEAAALRVVGYIDDRGGYIDNVAGTRSTRESARFRPAGTVRANGVPVSSQRAGFQSDPATLAALDSNVTFLQANNANLVQNDINDTRYTGFRASGKWEFGSDWSLTVGHARQWVESDGVFFADPELDEFEIQRFEDDRLDDDFNNTNWTIEGRLGALEALYTGAYTDRDAQQRVDYSDYLFVGQYLPYYICDSSVSYPGSAEPTGVCQSPNLFVASTTETQVFTHELRFNTPQDKRLRATVGGFYSDLQLDERNDFNYPGNVNANVFGSLGFSANFPQTTGFISDRGPFSPETIFRNDIRRTDEQLGFFGEVNFDLVPDLVTLTFGTRWYDIDVDFEGSANASFCNSFQDDADAFGTDISDLYNGDGRFEFIGTCDTSRHIVYTQGQSIADIQAIDPALSLAQATQIFNALSAPDTASTDGFIFKGNISVTPTDGVLLYATYSEGFRPGLLNRPGGAQGPNGFSVPFELDTDEVKNYEIGWKTNLFYNQVQFNGSAFFVDIERLQTTIFDPSITNLFFSDNAANAEVYGVEGDFIVAPASIPGLTVTGAFSVLDTEITDVITPTGDVTSGSELAYAPTFQGNLRARYEWDLTPSLVAHVMPQIVYSGSSRSDIIDINSADVDAWSTIALSAGVTAERWTAEVFAENLGDTYGTLANNFINDRERITVLRPRTIGVRIGMKY
ncbi:MAG: TonB-dependent receptor [Pseudomonadota bacterium]